MKTITLSLLALVPLTLATPVRLAPREQAIPLLNTTSPEKHSAPLPANSSSGSTLDYLADVDSITHTLHAFPQAVDSKDTAALDAIFTPTASYNIPDANTFASGLAEVKAVIAGAVNGLRTQCDFSNAIIEVDVARGTATARTYVTEAIYGKYGLNATVEVRGAYQDSLVRTNEGAHWPERQWKIQERTFKVLIPTPPKPMTPLRAAQNALRLAGAVIPADSAARRK